MKTYSEKLKSPLWQKKRLEILNRDNFTCVHCGDTETELQIHHLRYTKEPYDAPNEDLQTLCKHCHYISKNNVIEKCIKIKHINVYRTNKNIIMYSTDENYIQEEVTFHLNSETIRALYNLSDHYKKTSNE